MKYIDLRSDTVTHPTEAMRRAMCEAVVGDDVYGDDPTVNELQALAAGMLGKEAALFVPSGTMGNQLAVMTHTRRGEEIILADDSHIAYHEGGGAAALSGVMTRQLHYENHLPSAESVAAAIRPAGNLHYPRTGLIALENPLAMGMVVPLETMAEIHALAQSRGIPIHLDGARIFNAATALGVEAREIAQYCDSVMFCLSKGLCAPVGSILAGSAAFIGQALRNRKIMGGGMRQAGVLAAPGLLALREMTRRLAEDHQNAARLAGKLNALDGVTVDLSLRDINMVFFTVDRDDAWRDALADRMLERGVRMGGPEDGVFRWVTSHEVTARDVDAAVGALAGLL